MKNLQARVALMVIMAIPLLLIAYFYLFTEPVYRGIPHEYSVDNGDTLYHKLPPFKLVNQLGDTITENDVKGKILFIDFFSVKPNPKDVRIMDGNKEIPLRTVLHGNMARIHKKINWEKNPDIFFLSINTGDSLTDIESYTGSVQWPENNWWVLHGPQTEVLKIGQAAFKWEEFDGLNAPFQPITGTRVAMVDKAGSPRGYYLATDLQQERQMLQDYVALLRFDYPEETKAIRER
ncbi:MAG: hypothetical protein MRZ79_10970 [Bacteroidia bacterium]|nr:hypothetical protein [Bacteroidia bacterium]